MCPSIKISGLGLAPAVDQRLDAAKVSFCESLSMSLLVQNGPLVQSVRATLSAAPLVRELGGDIHMLVDMEFRWMVCRSLYHRDCRVGDGWPRLSIDVMMQQLHGHHERGVRPRSPFTTPHSNPSPLIGTGGGSPSGVG